MSFGEIYFAACCIAPLIIIPLIHLELWSENRYLELSKVVGNIEFAILLATLPLSSFVVFPYMHWLGNRRSKKSAQINNPTSRNVRRSYQISPSIIVSIFTIIFSVFLFILVSLPDMVDSSDVEYPSVLETSAPSADTYRTTIKGEKLIPSYALPETPTIDPNAFDSLLASIEESDIEFTSYSEKVWPSGIGRVNIKGKPNTLYHITVMYSSGPSSAKGLESKYSDSNGNVSWSWRIGSNTYSGTYEITVSGGGSSSSVNFEVA